MPLHRLLAAPAAAVVLLAGGAACSGDEEGQNWSPLPPVEPAVVPIPEDRDPDAVVATLARLDPCALLQVPAAPGNPLPRVPRPEARGPHHCTVTPHGPHPEVVLSVGATLDEDERFTRQRTEIAGWTAYVEQLPGEAWCTITLPVSFTTGVQVAAPLGGCATTTAFAAAVAHALGRGVTAALQRPAGPGAHTACGLLERALGGRAADPELEQEDLYAGYDQCRISSDGAAGGPAIPSVRLRLENNQPLSQRFDEGYDGRFLRVAGVPAYHFRPGGGSCYVAWEAWRSDLVSPSPIVLATIDARTCRQATAAAARVVRAVDSAPATGPLLDDVLLRPEQPDVAAAGACVDLVAQASRACAPHDEAEVPEDAVELLRRAEADPDVACSAVADLVRDRVGQDLAPVTAATQDVVRAEGGRADPPRECVFVEPDHAVRLTVRASTQPMPIAPNTEVAGHDAFEDEPTGDLLDRRELIVAYGDPAEPGHLVLRVDVRPDRRDGWYQGSPVDRSPLRQLDALAGELVEELL